MPRLYKQARPGADYAHSLQLLQAFKQRHPAIPTKSGLMVGLGETDEEILAVMRDLRAHEVDMLTIGQYLQPSRHHLPVTRFVTPEQFEAFSLRGKGNGLQECRLRADGEVQLSCGFAGFCRNRPGEKTVINNDVLRSIRYALDLSDAKVVAMIKLAERDMAQSDVASFLKKEEEEGFVECGDDVLAVVSGWLDHSQKRQDGAPAGAGQETGTAPDQ